MGLGETDTEDVFKTFTPQEIGIQETISATPTSSSVYDADSSDMASEKNVVIQTKA